MDTAFPDPSDGVLTYLFTDVEGSTRLWELHHAQMAVAHARHTEIILASVENYGGTQVRERGEGDSTFAVFADPRQAAAAATALQLGLSREPWPTDTPIRVRAALHLGSSELRSGDYNSADVNRCARIRSLAFGGQTLLSEAVSEAVKNDLPDGASLLDLGLHRLTDLSRPERIAQMCHADLPTDFPRLRSLDALPTNLPQQLTSFVGRERELEEVSDLLSSTRLLTLTGSGGAGKTRLALQVCAEKVDKVTHGVWLVELAQVSDAMGMSHALLSALGLREETGRTALETLCNYVRDRELLLILDNCEHLVETAARLADSLLRSAPRLRILATSREPLGVYGETAWRIPSLEVPVGPSAKVDDICRSAAVRLFVDRARASKPAFRVTPAVAASLAMVCRRLDGIPLAIELAAARCRVLSIDQIAERLDDRFKLLTGGSRTALPRQQTLRALIDWSHELLEPAERQLFYRLAVFSDGWTLGAVEAVCAGTSPDGVTLESADVLDLLESLVDKSLVIQPDEAYCEPRYRMLETVRHYASDRLRESGEIETLRDRHQAWCADFAQEVDRGVISARAAFWFDRAYEERENLRSTLEWRSSNPEMQANALRIAAGLQRYWGSQAGMSIDRQSMEKALDGADAAPEDAALARACYSMGFLCYGLEDSIGAASWYERALKIFTAIGDRAGISDMLNAQGLLHWRRGHTDEAEAALTESLAIRRSLGSLRGVSASLSNLGILANERHENERARMYQQEALEIQLQLGDKVGAATSLNNIGIAARDDGHYADARELFERAAETFQSTRYRSGIGLAHGNLGLLSLMEGKHDEAFPAICLAVREWLEYGGSSAVVEHVIHLARVWALRGDVERAVKLLGAAHQQSQTVSSSPFERQLYEQWEQDLRLRVPDAHFAQLFAEGEHLTLDAAVSIAVEVCDML